MGCNILGPRGFLGLAYFIISILSIYGVVGGVISYLQSKTVDNFGTWPFNVRPLICSLIAIRSLFAFAGCFAAIAAFKRQPKYLYITGFILLAVFTCSVVFGMVAYQTPSQQVSEGMSATFRKVNASSNMLNWISDIQWQYKCCGVRGFTDWYTVNTKIPASCCKPESLTETRECPFDNSTNGRSVIRQSSLYTRGCETFVVNTKMALIQRTGYEFLFCALISLPVAAYLYIGVTAYFLQIGNLDDILNSGNNAPNCSGGCSGNAGANSDFEEAADKRLMRRRQRRLKSLNSNDANIFNVNSSKFAKSNGQGSSKYGRPASRLRGNASNSKSLLGDKPSTQLTPIDEENDPEDPPKPVNIMWYQSLEKNYSTLSTTPFAFDMSSFPIMLPGLPQISKHTSLGTAGVNTADDSVDLRNTVQTLVSERPFSPNLSQNCSSTVVTENNNQRDHAEGTKDPQSEELLQPTEADSEIGEDFDGSQSNQVASLSPPNKYVNPMASVKSSTLATIHEESESSKGSPNTTKGASPNQSDTITSNGPSAQPAYSKMEASSSNGVANKEELNNNGTKTQYEIQNQTGTVT